MTVIVPRNYHLRRILEERRVLCIDSFQALREDIRALRIGILNIMPKAETYEFNLLHPLGRSILQIEPIWIRLTTHNYSSSDHEHLHNLYMPFEDAIKNIPLDGLILTGAPVEEIPFEQVTYWNEIVSILLYARKNIPSTLGICWGGLALAKILGIEKKKFDEKIFGIFETKNLNREHAITGELDDIFWCPQSRHSGIPDEVLEMEQKKGNVNLLAYSKDAGYSIFESSDRRFIMHLGHPEYNTQRIVDEYTRDKASGRSDVPYPANIDIDSPNNRWRCHCSEFFSQWIKYIHDCVAFGNTLDYCI